jgi:hypothetical protein
MQLLNLQEKESTLKTHFFNILSFFNALGSKWEIQIFFLHLIKTNNNFSLLFDFSK